MRIVFALDGTLANIEHRLHFIQNKPKDWPAFFRACADDTPNLPLCDLAYSLVPDNEIEVWSCRSDIVRAESVAWLNHYVFIASEDLGYKLRMRKDGDYRVDHVVKAEWLEALPDDEWPDLVFDDRKQVVDMWRAHGIVCCQVAPGEF